MKRTKYGTPDGISRKELCSLSEPKVICDFCDRPAPFFIDSKNLCEIHKDELIESEENKMKLGTNLLQYMNAHPQTWEQDLARAPFYINTRWDGNYVLLKYTQGVTDFTYPPSLEARGSIFYKKDNGEMEVVCMPFYKFFQDFQPRAKTVDVDWESVKVYEKVDGSLIKAWYHNDKWHWSTNGTIDARKAPAAFNTSFYDLLKLAVDLEAVELILDKKYTYMFELVSPLTQTVVPYDVTALYFLSKRNMETLMEEGLVTGEEVAFQVEGIRMPEQMMYHGYDEVRAVADKLDENLEGFVVCDRYHNRIKIKSPAWLRAAYFHVNDGLTRKKVIEALKEDYIDALYEYNKLLEDPIKKVENDWHQLHGVLQLAHEYLDDYLERHKRMWGLPTERELAEFIKKQEMAAPYLFTCWRKGDLTPHDFLMTQPTSTIEKMMDKLKGE